jgi:DNA-binding MarR family transcriptional regulator
MAGFSVDTKNHLPFSDQESSLANIVDALNRLNHSLDTLVDFNSRILKVNEELLQKINGRGVKTELNLEPDALSLLSLPLSLRKTAMVLYRLERATADDLARETGRLRAVESASANQLVRMGYLKKSREGRDVYFYIDSSEEAK